MEDKLKRIIEYFGINNQQRKLQEEVFELQEAITLFENSDGDIEDVKEELADILVLLFQFVIHYNLDAKDIMNIVDYKEDRTLERIKNGYYKKG